MEGTGETDIIQSDDFYPKDAVAKTPLIPTPEAVTPLSRRRFNPMAMMDAQTPLTPRTRLILGIGPDPSTPTLATELPNALFGSMEPEPVSPNSPSKGVVGMSTGGGESMASPNWEMQDQINTLQAELMLQKRHAQESTRQAEEAKHETANLRQLVTVLEGQMRAIQASGGGGGGGASGGGPTLGHSYSAPGSAQIDTSNIGLTILDVLGLLWLVEFIQSFTSGNVSPASVQSSAPPPPPAAAAADRGGPHASPL